MRSVESEGETIDEAIERALRTLQVSRDDVEVEILSGATRGLFGFGGTKARVRATVRAPLARGLGEEPARDGASRETSTPAAPSISFDARCRTILGELLSRVGVECTI